MRHPMRISPGSYAEHVVLYRGFTFTELQQALGMNGEEQAAFLRGVTPVDEKMACTLADFLGTSRRLWIELEREYRR